MKTKTVKAHVEKINALKQELREMLDNCTKEVRALNSDEKEMFDKKEQEIRELTETVRIIEERGKNIVEKVEIRETEKVEDVRATEIRQMDAFIRKNEAELRAMNMTSGATLVPTHLYGEVIEKLEEVAPLFSMVQKLTPVNGFLEIMKEDNIGTAGFVGDMTDVSTSDFTVKKVKLEQRRCGSAIELSQHLVNDAGIDIVAYAKNLLIRRLGYALDRAMVNGLRASNQFEGLESAPASCEIETAENGVIAMDDFLGTLNSLHPTYQTNAVWVMSKELFNDVAMRKDAIGNYYMLRQLNVVTNKPEYSLFGAKIFINDAVQRPEAGNKACFLVDFTNSHAGMIKKAVELRHISGDTKNALRGSHTLVIDMYADVCIKNEDAMRTIKVKSE